MYPKTLILVSLSLAKSLSLSTLSAHFMISFLSSNFSPYHFVDSACLITLYISSDSLVLVHPWYWKILSLDCRCLVCCVWLSIEVYPLHFCKSHVPPELTLSSGFSSLLAVNLGDPGVRDNLSFIALSPFFVLAF